MLYNDSMSVRKRELRKKELQRRIKRRKLSKRIRRLKLGENEKEIIKMIGLGLFVVASFALPNLPMALRPIMKMRGSKGFQKLLKHLRDKDVIDLGGERIKLTAKGQELLKKIYLSEIKIVKPEEWDGIWRLVSYDIPEKYRKSRDLFRSVLERNHFFQIQESLWVNPYECKEEIAVLAKDIDLTPYVIILVTDHLPNQKGMEEHFGLNDV